MITLDEKKAIEKELDNMFVDATISWSDSHAMLSKIINDMSFKSGVEVGVAYGNHSDVILSTTKVEKLAGIDPYGNYEKYKHDSQCFDQPRQDVLHNLVKQRLSYYGDRFTLMRGFSDQIVETFDDETLDFVYIDGNHSQEFVKKDIKMWWSKVRQGGVLAGHDYMHSNFPYVTHEVDSHAHINNKKVSYLGSHVWVIFK